MGAAQGLEGIPTHLGAGHLLEWEHAQQMLDLLPLIRHEMANAAHDEL